MTIRIQWRRGTAAQWATANPILASGEAGLETDTRKFKLGDGVTAWAALAYSQGGTIDNTAVNTAIAADAPASRTALGLGSAALADDSDFDAAGAAASAQSAAESASTPIAHATNTSNPHSVTASQVGLGNVDNTSDANKPVSTAQQAALDAKADFVAAAPRDGLSYVMRDGGWYAVPPDPTWRTNQNIQATYTDAGGVVTYVGANATAYAVAGSGTQNVTLTANGIVLPATIALAPSATTVFYCHDNHISGTLAACLAGLPSVAYFDVSNNLLSGSIPALSVNPALVWCLVQGNQLTGSIPSLSANTALTQLFGDYNNLSGYAGGGVPSTLGAIHLNSNRLPSSAVDMILSDLVTAGRTSTSGAAECYLNGGTNGYPSAAGEADKATLVSRGWTMLTNPNSLLCVGDSFTYNNGYGQSADDFYPHLLQVAGISGRVGSNHGTSGYSTLNTIAALPTILSNVVGDAAVIYLGADDPVGTSTVQASPVATATQFAVATGFGVTYAAGGMITINGEDRMVSNATGDVITVSTPFPTLPMTGDVVTIHTEPNLIAIGNSVKAAGFTKLIVCGQHYLNFATGGDTLSTPLPKYVALRAQQQAAAAALGAVYVDFHAYMRQLVVNGTYTQGDDLAWHVAVGNQHLNNVGEQILADCLLAAMQAQGWA